MLKQIRLISSRKFRIYRLLSCGSFSKRLIRSFLLNQCNYIVRTVQAYLYSCIYGWGMDAVIKCHKKIHLHEPSKTGGFSLDPRYYCRRQFALALVLLTCTKYGRYFYINWYQCTASQKLFHLRVRYAKCAECVHERVVHRGRRQNFVCLLCRSCILYSFANLPLYQIAHFIQCFKLVLSGYWSSQWRAWCQDEGAGCTRGDFLQSSL